MSSLFSPFFDPRVNSRTLLNPSEDGHSAELIKTIDFSLSILSSRLAYTPVVSESCFHGNTMLAYAAIVRNIRILPPLNKTDAIRYVS